MDDNKKYIVFSLDNYENKDELFDIIAKWVTPEAEEQIICSRENNCNCEVIPDND